MSYDACKYCGEIAFKTNGSAELICLNRAETGDCNENMRREAESMMHISIKPTKPLPQNRKCIHDKKIKNCKRCGPNNLKNYK